MSVTWNWKQKIGEISWNEPTGKTVKVDVYTGGNCICAMIENYKKGNEKMYNFIGFFDDTKHIKTCLGLQSLCGEKNNIYKGEWKKWKLNTKYKESWILAKYLTQAGIKVEMIYKNK